MSLQSKLLNPKKSDPVIVTMFSGKFPVAKMSTAKISEVDKAMQSLREAGVADEINLYTASIILDSMVDEKGVKMSESINPTALLETYEPGAISDALNAIYSANYSGIEGAEAAKKD